MSATPDHGDVPAPTSAEVLRAVDLLRALTAPVRITIVLALADRERPVHELVELTGASQSLVSQHLRVLRGTGVVRATRHGREVMYSLLDDHVVHIVRDAVTHAGETH